MFSPYSLEVTVGYHWREISKPAVLRPDNYILNFVTPLQTAQMLVTNGRDIYNTVSPRNGTDYRAATVPMYSWHVAIRMASFDKSII